MRLHKFVAVLLLGAVSLWAQTATKPADTTQKKAPTAKTTTAAPKAKAEHKCPCAHAKDAKQVCHCKEMMAKGDKGEECKGHKDANMSKMDKGDKMMAHKGCCGCCGGKCDRMKHKTEGDKAPKPGM